METLTLLNCDYKVAAKSIANPLKPPLPDLINYDHTGFTKGRFIGENIRLIDRVLCYAKEKNIPGLLLLLDFEKLSSGKPFNILTYFGFGSNILKWLNLFYCHPESCVLNNGWASEKNIKGIFVNRREIKFSQYADDTTLIRVLDG